MMANKLRRCPFCGHIIKDEDIGWCLITNTATGLKFVRCERCKACGPIGGKTNENAIDAWNRRPATGMQKVKKTAAEMPEGEASNA
jgi:hypothetical protein